MTDVTDATDATDATVASRDHDTLGLVLAGGASSRMGTPKATLLVHGEPLLRRVVRVAAAVSRRVVVIAEPKLVLPPGCLDGLRVPIERVDDPADARFGGPLRALGHFVARTRLEAASAMAPLVSVQTTSASEQSRPQDVLLLGVDHPALDETVTLALARRWREALASPEDADVQAEAPPRGARPSALVTRDPERGPQPLLAMYDRERLWRAVESRLAAGDARLRSILDSLPHVAWIDVEAIGPRALGWPSNTPEELARVLDAVRAGRDAIGPT